MWSAPMIDGFGFSPLTENGCSNGSGSYNTCGNGSGMSNWCNNGSTSDKHMVQ